MPLKLRISLYMALVTSSLTLLVGMNNSITLTAMINRTLVSLVFFAIVGYVFGLFAERFLKEKLAEIESQAKHSESESHDSKSEEDLPTDEFQPLQVKDFENISLTQK